MRAHVLTAAATLALIVSSLAAQTPDPQTLGPKVGMHVQEFSLRDQTGEMRSLRSVFGPKGAVLVFFRSADWCPYCKTQLVELQGRLDQLKRERLGLVAVSYDPVQVLAGFAKRRGITFALLSDSGSEVIKQYGILNTTVAPNTPTYGIPFPGTFIVDAKGVVTSRFFEAAYQERNTIVSVLVKRGAKVNVPASRIATPHVALTTYLTDQAASPGTHFSFVVDAVPEPRVHVYAPWVTRYQPISIAVVPQPGLVVRGAQFPKSDDYFFKPLNEHVPVYQRPFRVVQDLEIDPAPEAVAALAGRTDMTINASLTFQACDDQVCFNPESVPLSWTVNLKPLDSERPGKP
jgi:peroxiredoxin